MSNDVVVLNEMTSEIRRRCDALLRLADAETGFQPHIHVETRYSQEMIKGCQNLLIFEPERGLGSSHNAI